MNLTYRIFAIFNLFVTAWRCIHNWTSDTQSTLHPSEPPEYSYRGVDYPLELPFHVSDDPVAMTLHETVHFSLNLTDRVAQMEWYKLLTAPKDKGHTRLGPDRRLFTVVFWHHFHCLWMIHWALNDRNETYDGYDHLHHCFNYLRQTLLCQAADTLELGDFMERDLEHDRVGDTLVCRDWEQVYAGMEENYRDWSEWAEAWN